MSDAMREPVDFAPLTTIALACARGQANTLWRHAHAPPEATTARESALITRTLVDLYKIKTTDLQETCSNYLAGLSFLTPG
ncbi:MAG: hypothetical protein DMG93_12665 [Acidobacteria bacterium]|nr:MAG: hypothetical protein DMG93_12665 [Acidobacteriota bacterium]